jgi:hypothetical protein
MWLLYVILFGVSYWIFEWRARRRIADETRYAEEKWRAERLLMTHIKSGKSYAIITHDMNVIMIMMMMM